MCVRQLWVKCLAFGLGVLLAHPVSAEDFIDKKLLRKLEYGLICPARDAEKIPAPGTALGHIRQSASSEKIVYPTKTVPMLRNLGFGVNVKPFGPRTFDAITVVLSHPPYPNNDVKVETWAADIKPRRSNLNFFVFEYDEEMVPGTWTFQFKRGADVILSVAFEVVPPEDFPNVGGLCDGDLIAML